MTCGMTSGRDGPASRSNGRRFCCWPPMRGAASLAHAFRIPVAGPSASGRSVHG